MEGEDKNINSLNCEWHWEYANVNTLPAKHLNFNIMLQRLPLYVEIEQLDESVNYGTINFLFFFYICPIPDSYIFII
jgi:hypothetical protein